MNISIAYVSRSLLLAMTLCAGVWGAVPTGVTISGHVTGIDGHSIQIDGVSYELGAGSQAAHELSGVQHGDPVTIQISPRYGVGTVTPSHPVSPGHEVVHPATAKTQSTVTVVHAPGVR